MNSRKTLVAYFSASGQTAHLAKTIADVTHGHLFAIQPQRPYTDADLNWNDKGSRSSIEMNDPASRPAIAGTVDHMGAYDTVFVGFPIWWYTAPHVIDTFLESYDFSDKTVIPFATSGGSGMGDTDAHLHSVCPSADWRAGRRLSARESVTSVKKWIDGLGL